MKPAGGEPTPSTRPPNNTGHTQNGLNGLRMAGLGKEKRKKVVRFDDMILIGDD